MYRNIKVVINDALYRNSTTRQVHKLSFKMFNNARNEFIMEQGQNLKAKYMIPHIKGSFKPKIIDENLKPQTKI